MKAVFIFAGQGAQKVGMGKDLLMNHPVASEIFEKADAVFGSKLSGICFDGPIERLTETRFCQPAIYTMSLACLAVFRKRFPEVEPVGFGGLSLGEITALAASGCLTFEEGLRIVSARAELMQRACEAAEGAMASVLKADPAVVAKACADFGADVANYNCPGQIVVSGGKAEVAKACEAIKAAGSCRIVPLNVAGAYHSRLMAGAQAEFAKVVSTAELQRPSAPLAQNAVGTLVEEPAQIKSNIIRQVSGSVRWEECAKALRALSSSFVEFGPGNIVSGLVGRTCPDAKCVSIDGAAAVEGFQPSGV